MTHTTRYKPKTKGQSTYCIELSGTWQWYGTYTVTEVCTPASAVAFAVRHTLTVLSACLMLRPTLCVDAGDARLQYGPEGPKSYS